MRMQAGRGLADPVWVPRGQAYHHRLGPVCPRVPQAAQGVLSLATVEKQEMYHPGSLQVPLASHLPSASGQSK